jgi:hypothetical protein
MGVCTRIAQRLPALTAVIWHNDHLGLVIRRCLTACAPRMSNPHARLADLERDGAER